MQFLILHPMSKSYIQGVLFEKIMTFDSSKRVLLTTELFDFVVLLTMLVLLNINIQNPNFSIQKSK